MVSLHESLYVAMISSAPFNENVEMDVREAAMEEFMPFLEDESTIH